MVTKSARVKQPSAIKRIHFIAEIHGYKVISRKMDAAILPDGKTFLPDLVATAHKGKGKRVFEVEATVTNNTIFKSIVSLLAHLKGGAEQAYLVVPDKHIKFTETCWSSFKAIVRYYAKPTKGAPLKLKLDILGFSEISTHFQKAKKYEDGGHIGKPPQCPFLPRR
ncbi:MAG: hypothetical protein WCI39_03580 [Gallionellaceae bacterium]